MRFVSVRELRAKSAAVWKALEKEQEMVITSNGKPIALLSATTEESLAVLRSSRALAAIDAMQQASVKAGTDRLSSAAIATEIDAVRKSRPR